MPDSRRSADFCVFSNILGHPSDLSSSHEEIHIRGGNVLWFLRSRNAYFY